MMYFSRRFFVIANILLCCFGRATHARPMRRSSSLRRNWRKRRQNNPGQEYLTTLSSQDEDPMDLSGMNLLEAFSMPLSSDVPSDGPSLMPSDLPSLAPSVLPSEMPIDLPSLGPSTLPSDMPSIVASLAPTVREVIQSSTTAPSTKDSTGSSWSLEPTATGDDASGGVTDNPSEEPTDASSSITSSSVTNSLSPTSYITLEEGFEETPGPSVSPTLETCLMTSEDRVSHILAILDETFQEGNVTLLDTETPQGKATNWILYQDLGKFCPEQKIVQRWVVALIYFSTSGGDDESWYRCSPKGSDLCGSQFPFEGKRRFLSESSECEWAGITCNDKDCVTKVVFEDNGLEGTIPTEIGLLTDLAVLGMERGNLVSTIPSEIGGLTNLIFIDLDYNQLTGSLPIELYQLTDLYTLDLNDNKLTGTIDFMGVFREMEFLQLQSNGFTGSVPESMGMLTKMTTFNLHENDFTGTVPDSICALRNTTGGLLKSLVADCASFPGGDTAEIECTCCSSCRRDGS